MARRGFTAQKLYSEVQGPRAPSNAPVLLPSLSQVTPQFSYHYCLSLPGTLGVHGLHPPPVLLLAAEEVTSWKVSLSLKRKESALVSSN